MQYYEICLIRKLYRLKNQWKLNSGMTVDVNVFKRPRQNKH